MPCGIKREHEVLQVKEFLTNFKVLSITGGTLGELKVQPSNPMNRIQIEFSDERISQIEKLMEKCGIRTKKDLINNALTLLEWAARERESRRIIASIDESEDKYKEVLLPIFSNITPNAIETQQVEGKNAIINS
jgi:hypothetical protein